jgi:hypothetical protein
MDSAPPFSFSATLERITPVASAELTHFSMTAPYGGPLDVKIKRGVNGQTEYLLFAPRFSVYFDIPEETRGRVFAGQSAFLEVAGPNRSLSSLIGARLSEWLAGKQGRE